MFFIRLVCLNPLELGGNLTLSVRPSRCLMSYFVSYCLTHLISFKILICMHITWKTVSTGLSASVSWFVLVPGVGMLLCSGACCTIHSLSCSSNVICDTSFNLSREVFLPCSWYTICRINTTLEYLEYASWCHSLLLGWAPASETVLLFVCSVFSRLSWCEWMLSKGWSFPNYWVGQKVRLVFFCMMAPGVLSCLLTSFKTILLDCTVTAVISACIKENLPKLVNFCATILIFKMEESMQYLWHIMLFQERQKFNKRK